MEDNILGFLFGDKIKVGDTVKVMGVLITKITRIEGDKYYFLDDDGKEWQESRSAIEKVKANPTSNKLSKNMTAEIGEYYGTLVPFEEFLNNEEMSFESNGLMNSDAGEYMSEMKRLGVAEILLAVDGDCADVMFIRIDKNTDLAELMVHIHTQRPDEFTRQTNKNWFRLWWD